tara:strand:+ start:34 stop:720 length:687 start_codon:yes stop_codon:yes gene_type:complete
MKEAIFLDFDGVIVDSIHECYKISYETFFGFYVPIINIEDYRAQFIKNRYLVRPVYQYMILHQVLIKLFNNEISHMEIKDSFYKIDRQTHDDLKKNFEDSFFNKRKYYRQNKEQWLNMHYITEFGKTLQNKVLSDYYIITTKDKDSVKLLSKLYNINIKNIFGKEEYNLTQSKGKIITNFLNSSDYDSAIFVDDAVDHLRSVNDDRIKVYYADWAYDNNSNEFEVYEF